MIPQLIAKVRVVLDVTNKYSVVWSHEVIVYLKNETAIHFLLRLFLCM